MWLYLAPVTDHLITSRNAAERLGISVPYFHRLVDAKGLTPAVNVPGGKLWNRADIEALEAERATA